jgi:hypothetical protein
MFLILSRKIFEKHITEWKYATTITNEASKSQGDSHGYFARL